MASPQLENGFTRIANEILEALAQCGLPRREMQVVLVIFRYTYGFGVKKAFILHKSFKDKTLMTANQLAKAKHNLKNRNMITIAENGNGLGSTYSFNKNYHSWKSSPKMATLPKTAMPIAENGDGGGVVPIVFKENIKERVAKQIPVLSIILKNESEYPIFQTDINTYREFYPNINILTELTKCRAWNYSNPQKRKTKVGMKRHINGWLSRASDDAPPKQAPPQETGDVVYAD